MEYETRKFDTDFKKVETLVSKMRKKLANNGDNCSNIKMISLDDDGRIKTKSGNRNRMIIIGR